MALASTSLTEIAALRGKDRQAEAYAREVITAGGMGLQQGCDRHLAPGTSPRIAAG